MACQQTPTCTCNICNPTYTEVGCCDYISTDCVVYKGEDIDCLDISTNENLTQILAHLEEIICALTPGGYANFDFGCFASEGITTEQEFVEFISGVLCEVLGTQVPGGITSLSDLYALIQNLTVQVNLIKNQSVISCFQTLSGLSSPQDISILITAIQTIICDLDSRVTALESGSINTPITTVNIDKDVELTASGLNNHTLTARVILDPDGDNALTTSNVGLMCISPEVTVVDTQSINFSRSGLLNHTITGDVKISATVGNAASILADGIYVADATTTETPLVATDSTSIDFTQSGVNGHTFTGEIILDPSLLNIAQITANGLLVSSASIQDPITPIDTQTIDLTISGTTGHTLRADVIISPTAGNGLVSLANGLYSASAAGSYWGLSGNSILSTNFLGSTNSQPINFKVNSIKAGRLFSSGDTSFGYQASYSNVSTSFTTAIGYQASYSGTTNSENTAIGNQALRANLVGNSNTAVGDVSLLNSDGDFNTAIGSSTLNKLTVGQGNTALGSFAGTNYSVGAELVGSFNTFLGYSAMNSNAEPNVSTSIAIGKNAFVSADNMCVIGGTGADAVSVVIGDSEADASAILEAVSTTKGFLPPRMTGAQVEAIAAPAEGLMVYATSAGAGDVTIKGWYGWDGANWIPLM